MAANLGADVLGMVMEVPESPRSKKIADLAWALPLIQGSPLACLFRNHDQKELLYKLRKCTQLPDIFHLCGQEPLAHIQEIKDEFPSLRIWKSCGIPVDKDSKRELNKARELLFTPEIERIVLDSSVKGLAGGSGKRFPLAEALAVFSTDFTQVILAGGLNPENIQDVLRECKPYGVDVSSGVEHSAGVKSEDKCRRFINAVRSVETFRTSPRISG